MRQEVDIFDMIVSLLVAGFFLGWLSRVDALKNTQATEIFEIELQFTDSFGSGDELGHLTFLSFFYFFHHI